MLAAIAVVLTLSRPPAAATTVQDVATTGAPTVSKLPPTIVMGVGWIGVVVRGRAVPWMLAPTRPDWSVRVAMIVRRAD